MRGKIVQIIRACELSKPILCWVTLHYWELCHGQPCELSGRCQLARVKLSRLYCMCRNRFGTQIRQWIPYRLENLEKIGKHFPGREKSGNFEHTGKVSEYYQNTGKIGDFCDYFYCDFNFRQYLFLIFIWDFQCK